MSQSAVVAEGVGNATEQANISLLLQYLVRNLHLTGKLHVYNCTVKTIGIVVIQTRYFMRRLYR